MPDVVMVKDRLTLFGSRSTMCAFPRDLSAVVQTAERCQLLSGQILIRYDTSGKGGLTLILVDLAIALYSHGLFRQDSGS